MRKVNNFQIAKFSLKVLLSFWLIFCQFQSCIAHESVHFVKSVQIRSFIWSVFSCIRTEYGDLLRKSPCSVRIQENTDQKKLRIWTLFTQWLVIKKHVFFPDFEYGFLVLSLFPPLCYEIFLALEFHESEFLSVNTSISFQKKISYKVEKVWHLYVYILLNC